MHPSCDFHRVVLHTISLSSVALHFCLHLFWYSTTAPECLLYGSISQVAFFSLSPCLSFSNIVLKKKHLYLWYCLSPWDSDAIDEVVHNIYRQMSKRNPLMCVHTCQQTQNHSKALPKHAFFFQKCTSCSFVTMQLGEEKIDSSLAYQLPNLPFCSGLNCNLQFVTNFFYALFKVNWVLELKRQNCF